MERPSKVEYYLNLAKAISSRSPCTRRQFGAVIIVNDAIVSTGYNGPARGVNNCSLGCLKDKVGAKEFLGYDSCPAVHAEENAVINAARNGNSVLGGTLYIVGKRPDGTFNASHPCNRCSRVIINAGIARVITIDKEGKVIEYDPKDWVEKDNKWYEDGMKA